jgi:hypothetical protein
MHGATNPSIGQLFSSGTIVGQAGGEGDGGGEGMGSPWS